MNRIVVVVALAMMALTAVFTACTTEVVKEVPVEVVVEKEVPTDPGKLVIYSGRKESLIGSIIEEFEDLTGVDVEAKYGKTFPIATMILEEGDNSLLISITLKIQEVLDSYPLRVG